MIAESGIFKISASAYAKRLFRKYLSEKWYLLLLIVLPFVALSFVNINFIYVALMAVFIVLPMLLGFVYVYYAFSEECVSSIRRCHIRIGNNGAEWIFHDDENKTTGCRQYKWKNFCRYEIDNGFIELYLKDKGNRFLLVPLGEFRHEDRKSVIETLQSAILSETTA